MVEKAKPLTVDPVTDSFRKMQKGKASRPGAGTKNRHVVAPLTKDGRNAASSTIRLRRDSAPLGGHGADTQRKTLKFYEKGLSEAERLRQRRRR